MVDWYFWLTYLYSGLKFLYGPHTSVGTTPNIIFFWETLLKVWGQIICVVENHSKIILLVKWPNLGWTDACY